MNKKVITKEELNLQREKQARTRDLNTIAECEGLTPGEAAKRERERMLKESELMKRGAGIKGEGFVCKR